MHFLLTRILWCENTKELLIRSLLLIAGLTMCSNYSKVMANLTQWWVNVPGTVIQYHLYKILSETQNTSRLSNIPLTQSSWTGLYSLSLSLSTALYDLTVSLLTTDSLDERKTIWSFFGGWYYYCDSQFDIYAFTFVLWNIQRIQIKLYYYTLQQNVQGQDRAPHAVLQPWEVCSNLHISVTSYFLSASRFLNASLVYIWLIWMSVH